MTATRHIRRLQSMAERKRQLAAQVRNADNTARGERDAGEAEWDAVALEWAVGCHAELVRALEGICHAKALANVPRLVSGWNGPADKPYERHPAGLVANIRTNCGAIYALDEAITIARAAIARAKGDQP